MSKNLYNILKIEEDATIDDIKKAYRKLALQYHPDKNNGNGDKFKEISEAYQILSDPNKKKLDDLNKFNFNSYNYTDPHTIFNTIFKKVNPKILKYVLNIFDKIDINNTNNFNDFINNLDNLSLEDIFSLPLDYFTTKISKLKNNKNPNITYHKIDINLYNLLSSKYYNINIGLYQRLPNNILFYYKKSYCIENINKNILLNNQGNYDTEHKYPSDLVINIEKNVLPFKLYDNEHLLLDIEINIDELMNGFYYQFSYPNFKDNNKNYINIYIEKPYLSNLMYVIPEYGLYTNDIKGNLYINLILNEHKKNYDCIYDDYLIPKRINPFEE